MKAMEGSGGQGGQLSRGSPLGSPAALTCRAWEASPRPATASPTSVSASPSDGKAQAAGRPRTRRTGGTGLLPCHARKRRTGHTTNPDSEVTQIWPLVSPALPPRRLRQPPGQCSRRCPSENPLAVSAPRRRNHEAVSAMHRAPRDLRPADAPLRSSVTAPPFVPCSGHAGILTILPAEPAQSLHRASALPCTHTLRLAHRGLPGERSRPA